MTRGCSGPRSLIVWVVLGLALAVGALQLANSAFMLFNVLVGNFGSMKLPIASMIWSALKSAILFAASLLTLWRVKSGAYLLEIYGLWLIASTVFQSVSLFYQFPEFASTSSLLFPVLFVSVLGAALILAGHSEVRRLAATAT